MVKPFDVPIIGLSNNVPQDDPQFTLNMYAEKVSDKILTLKPTPGTVLDSQLGASGGGRGIIAVAGRLFGIRGNYFQEKVSGAWIVRGFMSSSVGKVGLTSCLVPPDIDGNPGESQIILVTETNGYVFELVSNTFTALTGLGGDNFFGGGSQVVFCAGRAYVFMPGTTRLQCSDLYNFKVWKTSAYFTALSLNTPILALASNGDLLYIFSADGFEVQQNQSASVETDLELSIQPVRPILSDRVGILAPFSALFAERYAYWLGRDSEGGGVVYRHQGGGRPERISTHPIERNIAAMTTPSDALGWYYESLGHYFYLLSFPAGNRTLTFDSSTVLWHDRCQREPVQGTLNVVPFIGVAVYQGEILALDYNTGKVFKIDDDTFTDDGKPIVRERIMSVMPEEADALSFYQSCVLFGTIGNTPVGQPDPQIMMKYSTDRGMTWSLERWQQAGGNHTYAGLVQWIGLGSAYGLSLWFRVVTNQFVSWRSVRIRAE